MPSTFAITWIRGVVGFIDWLDVVSKRRHSLTRVSCATRRSVEVVMWKLFAPKNRLEPGHSGCDQAPAHRQSWTIRGANVHVVVQIPDRCPASGGIVKQIIRMPVNVKISNLR